jgi:hypothetical protein
MSQKITNLFRFWCPKDERLFLDIYFLVQNSPTSPFLSLKDSSKIQGLSLKNKKIKAFVYSFNKIHKNVLHALAMI